MYTNFQGKLLSRAAGPWLCPFLVACTVLQPQLCTGPLGGLLPAWESEDTLAPLFFHGMDTPGWFLCVFALPLLFMQGKRGSLGTDGRDFSLLPASQNSQLVNGQETTTQDQCQIHPSLQIVQSSAVRLLSARFQIPFLHSGYVFTAQISAFVQHKQ